MAAVSSSRATRWAPFGRLVSKRLAMASHHQGTRGMSARDEMPLAGSNRDPPYTLSSVSAPWLARRSAYTYCSLGRQTSLEQNAAIDELWKLNAEWKIPTGTFWTLMMTVGRGLTEDQTQGKAITLFP